LIRAPGLGIIDAVNWFDPYPARSGKIPFAIDAAGRWRDVSEVARGKACVCVCPDCKGPLVARKGDVRVHHFAHADQRECRHALEASLFGMTMEQLSRPGARLALPEHGSREHWVRASGVRLRPATEAKFLAKPWVVEPSRATCADGFHINARSLSESDPAQPDLVAPELKLAVHVLSHRKTYEQALRARVDPSWRVLALNLGHYIKIWWATCDAEKVEKIAQAQAGEARLVRWLGKEFTGRGFLHHPEEVEKRRKFDEWIESLRESEARAHAEEAARQAAETRRWTIPTVIDGATPSSLVFKRVRPERAAPLTQWLAQSMFLEWSRALDSWIFIGRPGGVVPESTRRYLDADAPWSVLPDEKPEPLGWIPRPQEPVAVAEPQADQILDAGVGVCVRCGAPTDRVLLGDGLFQGKIVERCVKDSAHPLKVVGVPPAE